MMSSLFPRSKVQAYAANTLFKNINTYKSSKMVHSQGRRYLTSSGYERMKDRVCIVTGGGSGLGKGICEKYAMEGANVVVADLNYEAAKETVGQISLKSEKEHVAIQTDVTSEDQVEFLVKETVKRFERLDVIVCNAGIQHIEPVHELSFENWRKIMSVHLDSAFLCTRAATKQMYRQEDGGSILYIGSVHSKTASVLKAPYVSAKHGIMGLCRTVAKEGARYNVRANVICPGFVKTPLVTKQIPEQAKNLGITEEEVIKNVMLKDTVDGQFTTIEDISELAVVFASFETNALTGQSLIASHGWFME